MKRFKLSKIIGTGVLILSIVTLFFTLSSCAPTPVTTGPTTPVVPSTRVVYTDGGFDWGLLGLIGLFGLAGLNRKKRQDTDRY